MSFAPSFRQPGQAMPTSARGSERPFLRRMRFGRPLLAAATVLTTLPLAGIGIYGLWPSYAPPPASPTIVAGDYTCHEPAIIDEAGRVFLSFGTMRAMYDPDISLDSKSGRVSIPTAGHPVDMATDVLDRYVAARPAELNVPIMADSAGAPYVPLDIFAGLLRLEYRYFPESNIVVVDRAGEDIQVGTVAVDETFVRETPSFLSLKQSRLVRDDTVRVYGEKKGRYRVRDRAGRLGYVPAADLSLAPPMPAPPANAGNETPRPSLDDQKLSLVWEAVSGKNPNPAGIGEMPGLNVVSPTWFHVIDSEGTVQNLGDRTYVEWAHARGYQVWGLVTNGFSPTRTRAFLPSPERREKIVRQLLYYAKLYNLDGINLDFENMYLSQKDDYVALAREFTLLAHQQGLTVSVDVTFLSTSEVWSLCFDRRALAEICDYVMVMAYDEHTSGMDHAGSVGSLPWVEYGLNRILVEAGVPAEKCVLGLPFYTRLWTIEPGHRPKVTTYSMKGVHELLAEKNLTPTWDIESGQNYVEYTEEGLGYRLWIEDETSMAARVSLVEKYGLAGVAAWRRGFEDAEIWKVIEEGLKGE